MVTSKWPTLLLEDMIYSKAHHQRDDDKAFMLKGLEFKSVVHILPFQTSPCYSWAGGGYHDEAFQSKMLFQNINLFLNYKYMCLSVGKV